MITSKYFPKHIRDLKVLKESPAKKEKRKMAKHKISFSAFCILFFPLSLHNQFNFVADDNNGKRAEICINS